MAGEEAVLAELNQLVTSTGGRRAVQKQQHLPEFGILLKTIRAY